MGLLGKLASLFGGQGGTGDGAIHIYVECERCKSKVHVRLDRRHDVSVREDGGYWQRIESYIQTHSQAQFTHGICPDCMVKLYPEEAKRIAARKEPS